MSGESIQHQLKNYFVTGLVVIIPLATTLWLGVEVATRSIDFLTSIPKQLNPFTGLAPWQISLINLGVGLLTPVGFILFIGFMARNIIGQWLLNLSEEVLHRIPVAGSIYKTIKQILTALFASSGKRFRRVVLIEYPRKGAWSLGFVTGNLMANFHGQGEENWVTVFIPTTPNPTSGWYAVVHETDTVEVSISVEDAFKLLISGGIVAADALQESLRKQQRLPAVVSPNLDELVREERQYEDRLDELNLGEPVYVDRSGNL